MTVSAAEMLDALSLAEAWVEEALVDRSTPWNSLHVNDEFPHVRRLWTSMTDEYRVALHRIEPIPEGQRPLFHWHRWPAAFLLLDGAYDTGVGHGPPGGTPPNIELISRCHAGERRAMVDPNEWHWIRPTRHAVTTIMVFGKQYPGVRERKATRELSALPLLERNRMLQDMQRLFGILT